MPTRQSQDSDGDINRNLYLSGRQTGLQKPYKSDKKLSDKAMGKVIKKVPNNTKSTVRNYNIKEDRSVR